MRLIALAVGAITVLSFGLVSLQMQIERTESQITITGNTGEAFNMSQTILGDVTTTLGVSIPGFLLAALVAFVAVLLAVVLR